MGNSPSINPNNETNRLEKLQELNKINLPNCDINPQHKIMQLNMVCVDNRCEFGQQLNLLCAQCLEEKVHKIPNHQNVSVPSILREIGNQALQNEKIKQQQKQNQINQQRIDFGSGIMSTIDQHTDLSLFLESVIKSIECIKATCRVLENNVRDVIRIYSETKNQILLNSNWNVICKQYENITQQPLTSQNLKKCLEELRYYCKIEDNQVLLFDLEKQINSYLDQDTSDYAKQMIGLCKKIEDLTKGAINLHKPQNFSQYKQDCLQSLKQSKQRQDLLRQNELQQQNNFKDSQYSINQEENQNFEQYKTSKLSVSPQKERFNTSKIDYYNQTILSQQKSNTPTPQKNYQYEKNEQNIFQDSTFSCQKQLRNTQNYFKEPQDNQRDSSPQRNSSQFRKMQQTEPLFNSSKRITQSQLTDYIAQERQATRDLLLDSRNKIVTEMEEHVKSKIQTQFFKQKGECKLLIELLINKQGGQILFQIGLCKYQTHLGFKMKKYFLQIESIIIQQIKSNQLIKYF